MLTHNFPFQPTPFIGREAELREIASLLASDACRLVTLLGPGGMGKTRLAIEAAQAQASDFPDGVYFVPLQPLNDGADILPTIAQVLGVQFSPQLDSRSQLLDMLSGQRLLLVLDNVEHLLDGVDLLADCLAAAPGLKLMTTSRERLNLIEEWILDVGGLTVPDSADPVSVERFSAAELFVRGAQRVDRAFSPANEWPHIVRICQIVDGMPLALELASAWVRSLPCAEIVAELEHSLDILETTARNVLPRHRSMRAVLDYSWQLLTDDERQTFARLTVFRGGFSRDAAEAVCDASRHTLAGLVDKSWLRYSSDEGRYDIQELLRQYGHERLVAEPADADRTQARHCQYYMQLLRDIWPRMAGPGFAEASAIIETELENIRSGWVWAVYQHRFDLLDGTLQSLWFFYDRGSRFQEGEQVFAKAAGALAAAGDEYRLLYAKVLSRQAAMSFSLDRYTEARRQLLESIELLRAGPPGEALAFALLGLGMTLLEEDTAVEAARALFAESLSIYRSLNDLWGTAYALNWLSIVSVVEAEMPAVNRELALKDAEVFAQEGLDIFEELQSTWGIAMLLSSMSMIAYDWGDFARTRELMTASLGLYTEIDVHWGRANAYHTLADLSYHTGNLDDARHFVREGLHVTSSYRLMKYSLFLIYTLAEIELALGCETWAYELLAFVDQQRQHYSHPRYATFDYIQALESARSPELRAAIERGRGHDIDTFLRVLLDRLKNAGSDAVAAAPVAEPLVVPLTEREMDVLRLLADGLSNRQIADRLVLALGTVKTHVHNVCGKLGASTRGEAVARARWHGLL